MMLKKSISELFRDEPVSWTTETLINKLFEGEMCRSVHRNIKNIRIL